MFAAIISGALQMGKNNTEANATEQQTKVNNLVGFYSERNQNNNNTTIIVIVTVVLIAVLFIALKNKIK